MSSFGIPPALLPYLIGSKTDFSTLQPSILKINVIFVAAIVLTTGLRFVVRFRMLRSAGLDDLIMVAAVTFALLLSASCLLGRQYGLGKHLWNLNSDLTKLPHSVGQITKSLYGCYLAYATAITFTKYSIMATYIRIFPKGRLHYIVYAAGVIVTSFWICSIFLIIFTCTPIQGAWDYSIKSKCIDIVKYFYVAAGFNIATDLLLCFLPLPTIWALRMPKAQRVVVCLLFCLGTFACIASIIRITQLKSLTGYDISYQTVRSLNWSVIEVGTAIICASLSSLRPLAVRVLPSFFAHFTNPTRNISDTELTNNMSKIARNRSVESKFATDIYIRRSFDVSERNKLSPTDGTEQVRSVSVASVNHTWTGDFSRGSTEEIFEAR
ncbi:hypothetical protein ONS95_009915 [Cadophora gregata]|uniref:uncharacterized protein n=1 Tax=Cadophora gregata TaxID=51156 RepID=UPI0026DCA502|nr:uncharacterized protein ONS95_009915 [Cadophora gregata]KAK0121627.1 hypothetical protein ONS95_009915 [Cadophora gregata]